MILQPPIIHDGRYVDYGFCYQNVDSRPRWFLALTFHNGGLPKLRWIHIRGQRAPSVVKMSCDGQITSIYPYLQCYVFEREANNMNNHDSVDQADWVRIENLEKSLFLGLNHPIMGHVDEGLLAGRTASVYIAGDRLDVTTNVDADWVRVPLSSAMPSHMELPFGGCFEYNMAAVWGSSTQTPMWIVPRLLDEGEVTWLGIS